MDDKEDEKEKPGFWRRAEKVAGDIACLATMTSSPSATMGTVKPKRRMLSATAGIAFPLSLGFASYGLRRPMSQYCMSMPRNYIRRGWNVPFC